MEQNNVTINEMISSLLSEFKRSGYSDCTIWRYYDRILGYFRNYYRITGKVFYDPEITDEYVQIQEVRFKNGEISLTRLKEAKVGRKKLNTFYLTGKVMIDPEKTKQAFVLNDYYERLTDQFVTYKGYAPKAAKDSAWVVRKYLRHLEISGHSTLETVSFDEVKEYILSIASEVRVSSLHNVLLYLKHFHVFLKENGIPAPDCVELCSYTVYREMPIQSYVTDAELEKVLSVIDTSTVGGKRDRAMILLAANTGLRACDIIKIRLTDIDWRKGEIKLVQRKTGRTVYVPLLKETGVSLQDYILNARPATPGVQEVFLRLAPPKTAIADAASVGGMFKEYQKKAGIERRPFDGKGFHGLRRRIAKKLVVNGVPLTTISQILGHDDPASVRQYLSLDTENLKECALGLSGISVERRSLS